MISNRADNVTEACLIQAFTGHDDWIAGSKIRNNNPFSLRLTFG